MTITAPATDGPWLTTVIVHDTVVPRTAEAGPVLVIVRSALAATATVTDAWLLPGSSSRVSVLTAAEFVNRTAFASAGRSAVTSNVTAPDAPTSTWGI